jgi:hypothetical protein
MLAGLPGATVTFMTPDTNSYPVPDTRYLYLHAARRKAICLELHNNLEDALILVEDGTTPDGKSSIRCGSFSTNLFDYSPSSA